MKEKVEKSAVEKWKQRVDYVKEASLSDINYWRKESEKRVHSQGINCDLCGKFLGFDEDNPAMNLVSPERMNKAIDKGLKPKDKRLQDGDRYEMWKYAARASETDWGFCNECYEHWKKILILD